MEHGGPFHLVGAAWGQGEGVSQAAFLAPGDAVAVLSGYP